MVNARRKCCIKHERDPLHHEGNTWNSADYLYQNQHMDHEVILLIAFTNFTILSGVIFLSIVYNCSPLFIFFQDQIVPK